jgi:hypothetical protein
MEDITLSAASSRVILKDAASWNPWLIGIKTLAQKHKVWTYCNPELEAEPVIPTAPETLSMEECKKMDEKNWVQVAAMREREIERNEKLESGIYSVAYAIQSSVHRQYQTLLMEESPWALLRGLRRRFDPKQDPTYATRLRYQWSTIDRGLDRGTDIEKWLQNWENIQGECVKAGITDNIGASAHFLHAIAIMSPTFYEIWSLKAETEREIQ